VAYLLKEEFERFVQLLSSE